MRKMIPTRKTFLLSRHQRVDSPYRRKMIHNMRSHFAVHLQIQSWKSSASQSVRLFSELCQLVGLGLPEENHEAEKLEILRSLRRTARPAA